jgi:hypothetical protein
VALDVPQRLTGKSPKLATVSDLSTYDNDFRFNWESVGLN